MIFYGLLVFALPGLESLAVNPKIVTDFLEFHHLHVAVVFYCERAPTSLLTQMQHEFKYSASFELSRGEISKIRLEKAVKLTHPKQGIIFDMECNQTRKVFENFSRIAMFNSSYFWLMLSKDFDVALGILKDQNINLDTEISLAIIENEDYAEIFDVYNPSFKMNGNLVATQKCLWNGNESDGFRVSLFNSKFDQRSNLQGIVIHVGVAASNTLHQTIHQFMKSKLREVVPVDL